MLVSIILPTYNRANYITRAIHSVLQQTYRHWELLIVDDGSSDHTHSVLRTISDPRIRLMRHSTNFGVALARNTALAAARGDLIAFIDSDDVWKPEKLRRQITFLQNNPQAAAVFTDAVFRRNNTKVSSVTTYTPFFARLIQATPRGPDGYLLSARQMYLCLLCELPIKTPTLVVQTNSLRDCGGFNEHYRCGEDWELFLRLSRTLTFGFLPEPLVEIEVLDDATHLRHFVSDKAVLLQMLRAERKRLKNDPEARALARAGMLLHRRHLYWHYIDTNRTFAAAFSSFAGFFETFHPELLLRTFAPFLPLCLDRLLRRRNRARQGSSKNPPRQELGI